MGPHNRSSDGTLLPNSSPRPSSGSTAGSHFEPAPELMDVSPSVNDIPPPQLSVAAPAVEVPPVDDKEALRSFITECGTAISADVDEINEIFEKLTKQLWIRSIEFLKENLARPDLGANIPFGLITEIRKRLKELSLQMQKRNANPSTEPSTLLIPAVKPDSGRLGELLPKQTICKDYRLADLHFVDREVAMKTLLCIHMQILDRRSGINAGAGDKIKYPLLESLFGMGKTTFAKKYLALVERFVLQLKKEVNSEEPGKVPTEHPRVIFRFRSEMRRILQLKEPENDSEESVSEEDVTFLGGFLSELHDARTLYLDCSTVNLADSKNRDANLVMLLTTALKKQWKLDIDRNKDFILILMDLVEEPVFIIFDEIGSTFVSAGNTQEEQRMIFFDFVSKYCTALSKISRVYYLLCGRAPFLYDVGIRPENTTAELQSSPGDFSRISLSPINKDSILEILQKTIVGETSLEVTLHNRYKDKLNINEIVEELYAKTGGHPRTILTRVKEADPLNDRFEAKELINDVRVALSKYREGIRKLFEKRSEVIDLTGFYHGTTPPVPLAYLATRIHAGYCEELTSTRLHIPPPIENYLLWHFLPFKDFVLSYEGTMNQKHCIDKSRVFEGVIVKWFESVFSDPSKTCGEILGEFCPKDSVLGNLRIHLDPKKTTDGLLIRQDGVCRLGSRTTSFRDFADSLKEYIRNETVNIYFPAEKSSTPDIFVLPPRGGSRIIHLIGVQVKCYDTSPTRIGKDTCLSEAEKLNDILIELREAVRRKPVLEVDTVQGILIMCATSDYTLCDFQDLQHKKSILWSHADLTRKGWENFEVLIFNLSTAELRKRFFDLAQSQATQYSAEMDARNADRANVSELIERIIAYRHRH